MKTNFAVGVLFFNLHLSNVKHLTMFYIPHHQFIQINSNGRFSLFVLLESFSKFSFEREINMEADFLTEIKWNIRQI